MAFKGDLQSVALGDVLQMLFQGRKSNGFFTWQGRRYA